MPNLTVSDGVTIHFEIYRPAHNNRAANGEGNQPAIVLLHGLSQQRHFWGPVVSTLTRMDGPPIVVLDQRGHGESDSALDADYSITRCAEDVVELIGAITADQVTIVGHSWGASVALRAGAALGDRCHSVVLIDGGIFGPAMLGSPETVREQLRPPALGIPLTEIFELMRSGDLGQYWTPDVQDALRPTFAVDEQGLARTRVGVDRHMRVLDGLMDYSPEADLQSLGAPNGPDLWVVACSALQPQPDPGLDWREIQMQAMTQVAQLVPTARVLEWRGGIHDVPLQWPELVGGLIQSASTTFTAEGKVND